MSASFHLERRGAITPIAAACGAGSLIETASASSSSRRGPVNEVGALYRSPTRRGVREDEPGFLQVLDQQAQLQGLVRHACRVREEIVRVSSPGERASLRSCLDLQSPMAIRIGRERTPQKLRFLRERVRCSRKTPSGLEEKTDHLARSIGPRRIGIASAAVTS